MEAGRVPSDRLRADRELETRGFGLPIFFPPGFAGHSETTTFEKALANVGSAPGPRGRGWKNSRPFRNLGVFKLGSWIRRRAAPSSEG